MSCIFCSILAGEADATFVHRDDEISAFMDIRPVTRGHLLVIPNEHGANARELPDRLVQKTFETAVRIANAVLTSGLKPEGFDLFLADGKAAGQEVDHFHVHVIPRYGNDGFAIDAAAWHSAPPDRNELNDIGAAIERAL